MNKKLTLKQKIELYKMRKLSWKDRKEIDKPLTREELELLEEFEKELLEEDEK
jgi:hypothetical protein